MARKLPSEKVNAMMSSESGSRLTAEAGWHFSCPTTIDSMMEIEVYMYDLS